MLKRFFHGNKPLFVCVIIAVIALLYIIVSKVAAVKLTEYHDNKVNKYIEELKYESANEEKEILTEFTNYRNLSPEVRGHVYERLSLLYSPDKDPVLYYDTIGKAIYYLERGKDYDTLANIYTDLANYYYTHSEATLAQETLYSMYSMIDVSSLENFQMQSYIHRLQGILDCENGDYTVAEDHLLKSIEIVESDPGQAYYGPSYIAISKVELARLYFETGEYDKCRDIVNELEESDLFETAYYADILARDFKIPYYRVSINIKVHDQDFEKVESLILNFMDTCEKYGYRNIELEQLIFLRTNYNDSYLNFEQKMDDAITDCYESINTDMYHRQAVLIDSEIDFSKQSALESEKAVDSYRRRIINIVFFVFVFLALLFLVFAVIRQSNTDALTKVFSRRALNRRIAVYNKLNTNYTAIMIDIDNFKHVNDTYGHDKGDVVLRVLGKILLAENHDGFVPYRYGGEEFVLILKDNEIEKAIHTAERIRVAMGNVSFDNFENQITVSLGVGSRNDGTSDAIKHADENLYYSKEHGKNVVTFTNKKGKTVLYKLNN